MNLLVLIGCSVIALVVFVILVGTWITLALSRTPDDTDWIFENRGPLDHDKPAE